MAYNITGSISIPTMSSYSQSLPSEAYGNKVTGEKQISSRPFSHSRSSLPRPKLSSVQEVEMAEISIVRQDSTKTNDEKAAAENNLDMFGVRSYLHHFYDTKHIREPHLYEAGRMLYKTKGANNICYSVVPKRRRCMSLWWKIGIWCGVNLIVLGLVAVIVGYLVSPRPVVIAALADDLHIIDNSAIKFNANLDACKLAGLIICCSGGALIALAMLFPSIMHRYHDDVESNGYSSQPFGIQLHTIPPQSQTDCKIPATESVRHVQPLSHTH